ncbi:Cilia- and flagella-associated protein 46-like [Oopsacas minuta]|uniref:Cilia- and flagella-associated protein 46-like n=1 Tax=Oopsacas minuta TaxID=111878 RepID=A0AAV7JND5_9METZ|nr:Cilia- and flagella-associated protein 46-like [Oopsacas minuta]
MNTLSVTAVERFIFAGQWALDLNQSWLISNSLVCFWNYTRHLYTLKNEIVLLQPLRDIYSHITSKHNVSPHLLIYKLSYACINCLYQSSQHTKSVPPVIPGTTLKGSLKNDKDKKNVDTPISSSGFGTQLEVVSEELLKEAKEICEFSLSLLMNIDLNLTNFKQLVSIWVKVLIQLGQKIRYEFLIELFKDSDDLHIIKATVMIEVLSSKNSNLLVPEIALSSAFDCLTCSKSPNSIINLELIIELAGLYLNVEHYSMVSSCVEYGRNIGILLLSESQTMIVHQKICFCLSQLESISAISLSCVKPFARSSEIFEQMLKAFSYGNESNSVNLFLYCLQMILNYCRLVLNTPEFTYFLTKNATTILSYLSKYKKVEISLFRFDKGKDIRIEFFMLCLDAFSRQKMWNIGLKFVELALTQIPRESHQNLFKYLIIFKSNMKIDVHMDILRIIADFDQIDQSDLWLMAAHASTSFKFKFVYYKSALESLSGVDDFLLRIEVLFEFLSWLVLIKYPPKVLCTLFEDTLGQLIEYVFERLIDNIGDDDGIYQKDAPLAPEFIHQNKNYGKFNQSFEEWTTPEIDCFFRLSIISLILSGRSDGLLYDSNLRLLLFCVYSMLNQTVVRDTDLRMTTQELSKKSKGSTKFNTNMAVPHSLPDWSQYILNRTQLIDTNQRPKISLKYPNITMYYLNYFKEELKLSLFSHYQLIPLLLIHYISTTNENCPRSWLHLSYISMMIYSKKFIFDSSYEFWKEKLYGEYFAKEDRSILHEITKDFHNQAIVLPGPFLPDSASATCKNINLDIFYTFYQSDFIIYLALEISNVLLELGELQPTIDIVAECEVFLELSPKLFFDYKIQSLKASIHDAFNFSINGQSIITRMLQDKFLPINVLLHFYNSVGNFLEYSLANEYLENYIRLFHKNISDKSWNYYSYIKTRFEFELATRKLDFAFSHIETNRKRNIIDIEILLETLYSCFCMYYSSQNFIDCISSLKNYVFYLCKLATIIDEAIPLETYSRYVMKTVLSYKRLNQLYIDTISYLNSVSLEFDVFLDNYSPICSDFANTQISFSSFGITVFEKCTELCTKKLNFHISTSTHRIFDMLVYRNFKSLEFSEQLIQNCFRIITESIAILVSLQNNPSLEYIVQLSRAMIALYHYFGTETDQMWVCYNSDSDQYSRSTMLEIIEFKEHEISQSKALFYIASSNKHFQQLTLLCLKDGININLLTDISYIQFSAIDLIPNYTRLFH